MLKKKAAPKKATKKVEVVEEVPVVEVEEPKVEEKPAPAQVFYQGYRVVKILEDGHTDEFYHCEMAGGLTMHVPKRLFNG